MKNTTRKIKMAIGILTLGVAAQSNAQPLIGVKIGANVSSMSIEDSDFPSSGNSKRIGFNIGIPVTLKLNKYFYFQPELAMVGKGSHLKFEIFEKTGPDWERIKYDFKYKLQYIEIPMLFKFGLNNDKYQINVLAGPSLGLLTKAQMSGKLVYTNSMGDYAEEPDSYTPSIGLDDGADLFLFDFGANLGLEAGLKLGQGFLFAEGRYQTSLRTIATDKDDKIKNMGVQIHVGYRIPLGR